MIRTGLILAALAVLGFGSPAHATCNLSRLAELPITLANSQPMLHTQVDGHDATFIVDSGAFFSMMSPAGAAQLNMRLTPAPFGFTLTGVGGSTTPSIVTAKTFSIAGATMPRVDFLVGGGDFGGGMAVGLLGQNFLHVFDVEYDLANGMIRLFRSRGCSHTNLAYWAKDQAWDVIPIIAVDAVSPHTRGTVSVNGVQVRAMFDTGADMSVLSPRGARRAGIRTDGPDAVYMGETGGIGPHPVPTWAVPVKTFAIGGEQIKNTKILVGDIGEGDEEMLIGADFFLSHHILVSNEERQLFFTYNGGQVFSLAHRDSKATTATADSATGGPTEAEALARRGAASAARRDWPHALADLDKAVALKPQEPRYLFMRASAHAGAEQPAAAIKDLDAALALKADDPQALVMRASLTLELAFAARREKAKSAPVKAESEKADKDEVKTDKEETTDLNPAVRAAAAADLDAADKAAPPSSDLRLEMASLNTAIDRFAVAVAQYDLWTRSHDEDSRMGRALNGRCWARALAGVELDKALADCNDALRRQPKAPNFLDSRGLVRLRRGEFERAIADYDAVLAKDPEVAWSLYGRGVARVRTGKATEGEADIAAAKALAPKLPDRAASLGIKP